MAIKQYIERIGGFSALLISNVNLNNASRMTNAPAPAAGTDLARESYIDDAVAPIGMKKLSITILGSNIGSVGAFEHALSTTFALPFGVTGCAVLLDRISYQYPSEFTFNGGAPNPDPRILVRVKDSSGNLLGTGFDSFLSSPNDGVSDQYFDATYTPTRYSQNDAQFFKIQVDGSDSEGPLTLDFLQAGALIINFYFMQTHLTSDQTVAGFTGF